MLCDKSSANSSMGCQCCMKKHAKKERVYAFSILGIGIKMLNLALLSGISAINAKSPVFSGVLFLIMMCCNAPYMLLFCKACNYSIHKVMVLCT
jgi:hypothetical protein